MKGKFIVIEGTDGSGKGTHSKLLAEWLKAEGHQIETFDFPQYGQPSAYFVEQYLNGAYGELDQTDSYRGSLFYAMDRFAASQKIREALEAGKVVLSNRYVASNMGHQGAKIDDPTERTKYFNWNAELEYKILGSPRPSLNVVLHMPSEQAQKFVDQKAEREHLAGKTRDLHEASLGHLEKAEQTYLELCRDYPQFFSLVECQATDGSIRTIDDVQAEIRTLAKHLLA